MNSILRSMIVVVAMIVTLGTARAAEPSRLAASFAADLASKYVWRGQKVNDDAVFQPSLDVGYKALGGTFGVNYWLNMDMSDDSSGGGARDTLFSEADLTISYSIDLPVGSLSLGVIDYEFPADSNSTDTRELFISYGIEISMVELGLAIYHDTEMHGVYANLSAGTSFKLNENATVGIGLGIGWADEDYNNTYFSVADEDTWNDFSLSVLISGAITKKIDGSVSLNYSEIIDSDLSNESGEFFVVAGISYTF